MAGIHFPITADNANFLQRLNEVKVSVNNASQVIKRLGQEFDVSTVENKIIAINRAIRDNETQILKYSNDIKKWENDAKEAFNAGKMSVFSDITKDIEEQSKKLSELTQETQLYRDALSVVESSGGYKASTASIDMSSAPQLFKSKEDFQYVESLKEKVAELQDQISKFDGSDEDLQVLRNSLSDTQKKLNECQMDAINAASALGTKLGTKAAEASEKLYNLNKAVEDQQAIVKTLSTAVEEASNSLKSLDSSANPAEIEHYRTRVDVLSTSLQNAQIKLAELQAEQTDANQSFVQINQEVELHDSLMVKLLGGYENYQKIIGNLPGPIQGVIGSINGMTGAAKAFIATPLGAFIAVVVLALQSLKTWFDSSVEGQLAFAEVSGYVSGILDQLKKIVIKAGKAIYEAIANPKKAVVELWESIKANLVNRVEGLGSMFKNLGKVITESFSGNFGAAGDALKDMTKDLAKVATGVDDITGKTKEYVKGVHEAAKANADLAKEERQIEIDASKESIESAKRNRRMQELRADMYSKDKSKAKAALEEYEKLSKEDTEAQKKLQRRRIALQATKNGLTTSSIEDVNKLRELQKGLIDIDTAHKSRMAMLQRRTNSIDSGKTDAEKQSDINKAHQKVLDLMKQQAEDELKIQEAYEYQRWQNRIDLMEEGEAKVLEQMRLDLSKERDALKEQEKQAIQAEIQRQKALFDAKEDEKAARTKGYGKQIFDPTSIFDPENGVVDAQIKVIVDRYAKLNDDLKKQQEKAEADRLKQEQAAWRDFNKEFGTYQQQRLAIQQEYDEKIAQAVNEGQRAILDAQKNKAVADLDFNQWMQTGDIALAFGDLTKLSDNTIDKLISDMEKYREKVIATLDPDKIQKWEDALNNLRSVRIDDSFGVFSTVVPEYFKKRKSVSAQKESAAVNYDEALKSYNVAANKVKEINNQINEALINGEDTAEFEKQLAEAKIKLDTNTIAVDKTRNAFKALQEQWDKLESPEDKFYGICEAMVAVTNLVGPLVSQMGEMFDAIGEEGLGKALSTVSEAIDSVNNIASGFAQGGLIGGITAGAGVLMKWTTKLFMSGDTKHQKNIEKLQDRIDALQKSYDKLDRSIDRAYSSDASNLIEQQDRLLQQQKALIRQQMAEEKAKKKADKDKIKEYQSQIEEIDRILEDNKEKAKEAIIGKDIKSAISDFASAYAEAWNDGTKAASASMKAVRSIVTASLNELLKQRLQPTAQRFYDQLAEYMKNGILSEWELTALDHLKAQMDSIAAKEEAQYKMLLERYKTLEEIQEELTDTTFDSVRDNFKSLLSDMESSSADFSDSFTDMLRSALIEGLMSAKYDKMLKEWYAEFANKMKDQKLTDSERDYLRQKYQAIVDSGIADRNAINEIVGQGAFAQSASQGGFSAMDQDTASELNGRFTALVELQATSNTLLNDGNAIGREILLAINALNNVSQVTTGDNTILLTIKDMMFLSTGYLEDIATYSKRLISIDTGIDSMRRILDDKL